MKPQSLIISLCALLVFLSSCKEEIPPSTGIYILIDVSEEKFKNPEFVSGNTSSILKLMNLDKEADGFAGGEVRFSLINDISDSKSARVAINPARPGILGENPLVRKDEVERFRTSLESVFEKTVNQAEWGTGESKIYRKVARELNQLRQATFDRKIMIIYSDMLENSRLFSFYKGGWKDRIKGIISSPANAIQEFSEAGAAMPDLSGMEIKMITLRTVENDEMVNLSERLWSAIFSESGAIVSFSSGLD